MTSHPPDNAPAGADLPQPGAPGFAVALVAALNASPDLAGWQVDGTLVALLLLALMARRGGVLLDVAGGGASNINKVAKVVGALTSSVFGLDTRIIRLNGESSARDVSPREGHAAALIVTGLEEAPPPVAMVLRSDIVAAEAKRTIPLIVWVRDEDKSDVAGVPAWLVDLFAVSASVYADDLLPPPSLPRQALIPPAYVMDLRSLLLLTHIHPPLESYINNVLAALALHPKLKASISARGAAALTTLVKAQRLLATPFDLPPGWLKHLREWRAQRWSEAEYDGGMGSTLPASALAATEGVGGGEGYGQYGGGPGGVDTWSSRAGETPTPDSMLGEGATDWFCLPENVAAAWETAVRHRVSVRPQGGSTLFALNGSAQERVGYERKNPGRSREAARRRRAEVDDALVQILLDV